MTRETPRRDAQRQRRCQMTRMATLVAATLSMVALTTGGVPGTSPAQDPQGQVQEPDGRGLAGAPRGGLMVPTPFPVGTAPSPLRVAQTACCVITALNARTGVVTAKETATGRSFEFEVTDAKLLSSLKIGQPV